MAGLDLGIGLPAEDTFELEVCDLDVCKEEVDDRGPIGRLPPIDDIDVEATELLDGALFLRKKDGDM